VNILPYSSEQMPLTARYVSGAGRSKRSTNRLRSYPTAAPFSSQSDQSGNRSGSTSSSAARCEAHAPRFPLNRSSTML